jgi:uncharacterized LabA/DUF88 family protein
LAYRVRLFIDFWNYQLSWNSLVGTNERCDWPRLPVEFVTQAQLVMSDAGLTEGLQLEETRVYASYNPSSPRDVNLKKWLSDFLDRKPSFRVFTAERKDKPAEFYCRRCMEKFSICPSCKEPLVRSREKGVDTAIVTDILSLAWEDAYDVAILVSSDADMIPCVQRVQEKGFKIVNATWPPRGQDLSRACWASFSIPAIADKLIRRQ